MRPRDSGTMVAGVKGGKVGGAAVDARVAREARGGRRGQSTCALLSRLPDWYRSVMNLTVFLVRKEGEAYAVASLGPPAAP